MYILISISLHKIISSIFTYTIRWVSKSSKHELRDAKESIVINISKEPILPINRSITVLFIVN